MPSSKSRSYSQRAIFRGQVRKLQRAGLLGDVDMRKKPTDRIKNIIYKYRGVISGRQAAVKISSAVKAKELRNRIGEGGVGKVVIVPREKGEKFRVGKDDVIKSTRKAYGQTVEKTVGDKFRAPATGEKVYYTIPRRKRGMGHLKRSTFASFDEMLFYLTKYEVEFEDIEDYIEVERFRSGTRSEKKARETYNRIRAKALRKKKYRRAKRKKGKRGR